MSALHVHLRCLHCSWVADSENFLQQRDFSFVMVAVYSRLEPLHACDTTVARL